MKLLVDDFLQIGKAKYLGPVCDEGYNIIDDDEIIIVNPVFGATDSYGVEVYMCMGEREIVQLHDYEELEEFIENNPLKLDTWAADFPVILYEVKIGRVKRKVQDESEFREMFDKWMKEDHKGRFIVTAYSVIGDY